jgi:hypothetical protein
MANNKDEVNVLDKLHKLQVDCSLLNDFIERVLSSGGICKRYTNPNEPVYCNLKQRRGHCTRGKENVEQSVDQNKEHHQTSELLVYSKQTLNLI